MNVQAEFERIVNLNNDIKAVTQKINLSKLAREAITFAKSESFRKLILVYNLFTHEIRQIQLNKIKNAFIYDNKQYKLPTKFLYKGEYVYIYISNEYISAFTEDLNSICTYNIEDQKPIKSSIISTILSVPSIIKQGMEIYNDNLVQEILKRISYRLEQDKDFLQRISNFIDRFDIDDLKGKVRFFCKLSLILKDDSLEYGTYCFKSFGNYMLGNKYFSTSQYKFNSNVLKIVKDIFSLILYPKFLFGEKVNYLLESLKHSFLIHCYNFTNIKYFKPNIFIRITSDEYQKFLLGLLDSCVKSTSNYISCRNTITFGLASDRKRESFNYIRNYIKKNYGVEDGFVRIRNVEIQNIIQSIFKLALIVRGKKCPTDRPVQFMSYQTKSCISLKKFLDKKNNFDTYCRILDSINADENSKKYKMFDPHKSTKYSKKYLFSYQCMLDYANISNVEVLNKLYCEDYKRLVYYQIRMLFSSYS